MTVQKGKRRRKVHRHYADQGVVVPQSEQGVKPAPEKRPAPPRQRWQPPYWLNLVFGVVMLAAGVAFSLRPLFSGGSINASSLVVFVLYVAVAGIYIVKGWRQRQRELGRR